MGRYKENYKKIKYAYIIAFFIVFIPFNIYSSSVINIDGYLKKYDIPRFTNVLQKENKDLFIMLNSSGGKLDTLFKILDNLISMKAKGIKIYTIINKDRVSYAGAFFIVLLSDIVFYTDPLNLGVFTPLSKETYSLHKKKFDEIFKAINKTKDINNNSIKKIFLNGDMFKPELFSKLNIKFIQIENLSDIEYSVASYKNINLQSRMSFISYLYTPNFIFLIFNLTIILIFVSVYFSKNILFSILSIIFVSVFIFLSFEMTISLKAIFAIFFTHFMLIFKEYIKYKYIVLVLSFSVFILSSIYLINPLDSNYYIDTGFRVDIFMIFITVFAIILMYKLLISFFNRRFKKFNNNKNELKYQNATVVSVYPLKVNILGDEFPALSINKLYVNSNVKIIGFRGIKMIVERVG